MEEENNTGNGGIKNVLKKSLFILRKPILILIIAGIIALLILSASAWFIKEYDGTQDDSDPKNGPAAANSYMNDVEIGEDGSISLTKSPEELWEELKKKGNRLTDYLSSPQELSKLMNAQIATEYPDTRPESEIDKDIDWKSINKDTKSKNVQGIIKLKRKTIDNEEYTMTYVDPDTFDNYISSGSGEALKHFTIEKRTNTNGSNGISGTFISSEYSHWPSPDSTTISSPFGWRTHPVYGTQKLHGGTDIAAALGTDIEATEAGVVEVVAYEEGGAGNYVQIDHGNGIKTLYMHMRELSSLHVGDQVSKGQVIGHVGSTGASTGPHLHFEVRVNGEKVDAMTFKYDNGQGNGTSGIGSTYGDATANDNGENGSTNSSGQRQYSYVVRIAVQSSSGINPQYIEYKNYINKYTMPFNYLWAMLLIGEDKDLVFDLAELVYNSEFVITVHDSLTVTTEQKYHRYKKRIVTPGENEGDPPTITYQQVTEGPVETVTEYYTTDVALTKANSWIAEYTQEYKYEYIPEREISDTGWESVDISIPETRDHEERIVTKEMRKQYTAEPAEKPQEKTDKNATEPNFVTVFLDNYDGRSNILGAVDWLFDILEKNNDTKDMVDLTKYLFYKITGRDYGVTDFDTVWSAYRQESFSSIGGIYGGTLQEKVWFALKDLGFSDIAIAGAMGNIDYESGGFRAGAVEAGGTGEGIGLVQWSFSRRQQLEAYANSKGVSWKDENTQIEFLIAEISGQGPAAGYADRRLAGSIRNEGITSTYAEWKDSTTIEDATIHFMRFFESPASRASYGDRLEAAKKYYNEFQGKERSAGNGNVLAACEEVMQIFLSRNAHYSVDAGRLIYNDINRCLAQSNYICCASYTTCVLYRAGLLPADHINKYNYHWTGSGGIPDMLRDAGWKKVPMSERQPGDVANKEGVHVLIYAGGDNYYDQSTCVVSSSGKAPSRSIKSGFMSAYGSYDIWRAPGR